MQSNNNIYKNLPGNINNRGAPNYPNSRINNEFQSKKGIWYLFELNKTYKIKIRKLYQPTTELQ